MTAVTENATIARRALEQVCATGDMALAPSCYAEDFADHVGGVDYHGLDGVRQSTAAYRALFEDLAISVVDQIAEGDRVASRWTLTGYNRGRRIRNRSGDVYKPSTIRSYEEAFRLRVQPVLGATRLTELTSADAVGSRERCVGREPPRAARGRTSAGARRRGGSL